MFSKFLEKNKCFKLICGAGNEDTLEIMNLVAIYSKAGCPFFDISANPKVINAAKNGLQLAGIKNDRYLCVSIGTKNDPHFNKAFIDNTLCNNCRSCISSCPQNAIISQNDKIEIITDKCVGCLKCNNLCRNNAIKIENKPVSFSQLLSSTDLRNIDCIELHTASSDATEIKAQLKEICENFDGVISISLNKPKLQNEDIIKILKKYQTLLNKRFMVQADGISISGWKDDIISTLPAIESAKILQGKNINCHTFISGGTNSKTAEIASQNKINFTGIAIGSYARKIVKKYTEKQNLIEDEQLFNEAVEVAKKLVETVYKKY